MCNILIFGGTTEGRILAEYCVERKIYAIVSVVSDYGLQVLPDSIYLTVLSAPMDREKMEQVMAQRGITLVIDATHPYAAVVTDHVQQACKNQQITYIRVIRQQEGVEEGSVIWKDTPEDAVTYLSKVSGSIFVTTGSKDLKLFTRLQNYKERVYVRVLPSKAVMEQCEIMGFTGRNLIGMQGPFSKELNLGMLRQTGCHYLVTKEAGKAGGFKEKLEAARECDVTVIVIGRPLEETGVTVEEACHCLDSFGEQPRSMVYLIGVGMSGGKQLTLEALEAIKKCDVILGAPRMLECVKELAGATPKESIYLTSDILNWLKLHKEYRQIGVLCSGDTGFYSGAKKLSEALESEEWKNEYETIVIPGISTVSYLCAKLKTSWEDVHLISCHGREADLTAALKYHRRVFALLGGVRSVENLCITLQESGLSDVKISVGERLAYPNERILTGTPRELGNQTFDSLAAVLLEREDDL